MLTEGVITLHIWFYYRGENGPGGFIFIPIPNEPNKCQFIWYLNTNL